MQRDRLAANDEFDYSGGTENSKMPTFGRCGHRDRSLPLPPLETTIDHIPDQEFDRLTRSLGIRDLQPTRYILQNRARHWVERGLAGKIDLRRSGRGRL